MLRIKQERIKEGWSQKYVAKQISVTPEMIYYIETGKRKPSYDVLVKLEDLFKLNHRELFAVVTDEPTISRENNSTRAWKTQGGY